MPGWVTEGYATYAKRLPRDNALVLEEVPAARRHGDVRRCVEDEGERLLQQVGRDDCVIALDERGAPWSTVVLAKRLTEWRTEGRDVVLLVGGADGLSNKCKARSQASWALSAATLPHALVRIVVAEQIYRAWTVVTGHPYHRA